MFKNLRPLLAIVYSLLLPVIFPDLASAANPVVHITARPTWINTFKLSDKKVPLRQVTDGYFTRLFEEQTHVENKAVYRRIIREMVSEAGIQNGSQISISFEPAYEQLQLHDVTVWRNGQPQSRLTAKSFKVMADEKDLSRFIYQGSFSAFCILDDIRKGDRIEFSYTITGRNPIFGNHFTDDLYFQGTVPYGQMYRSMLVSPGRKINFKAFNKAPVAGISSKNGLTSYEWNVTEVATPPYADNEPNWFNNYNHIQVSDFGSWQEVISWGRQVNPIATDLKGELAARVARLKADAGSDTEKYFRNAVQMVQDEVRYMGIELGEYSHRANPPEKVFNQRYGDCKDKSLLLASVLEANGIEAHMVLINTNYEAKTDEFIPSPTVFDHACVAAVVNGKPVYIDATIAYQRGKGVDLYFPLYGKGLVLKAGNTGLTTIRPGQIGKTKITELFTIPDEKGKVDLAVTSIYTLNEADQIRNKFASGSIADIEKDYLNYYAKFYPKIEQAADSITVKDDIEKNEFTTIEYYKIPGFLKEKEPGKFSASLYADYINGLLPNIPARASLPVSLNYPENIDYTVRVVMTNGWDIQNAVTSIEGDAYYFHSQKSVEGDTLTLNYLFSYLKDHISVAQLEKSRKDVKQISDDELGYSFTFTPDLSLVPFRLNVWMLAFLTALFIGLVLTAMKLYCTQTRGLLFERGASFTPIGGWLILVGIGLITSPLAIAYRIADERLLDLNTWNNHISTTSDFASNSFITAEAAGNVILLVYALFCFILLVNRRDILPKYITGFYALAVIFVVINYIGGMAINGTMPDDSAESMFRTIVFGAIWISYFKKSQRVEQTFIVPYPANNYSYQDPELTIREKPFN